MIKRVNTQTLAEGPIDNILTDFLSLLKRILDIFSNLFAFL